MLSGLDIALIACFVAYCVFSGLRSRAASSRSLEQYFLSGRTLSGFRAGISMAATQFAADTPLLVTGLVATSGLFGLWRLWIYALAFFLMGFVLGPCWRRAGVLTDAELSELRYDGRLAVVLRAAKALYFGTIFNCAVIAMVLFAAARIAEPLLPWHAWLDPSWLERLGRHLLSVGIDLSSGPAASARQSASNALSLLAILSLSAMYSTTGGLRAVVSTDVAQFFVAMVGTLAYAAIVVDAVGGLALLKVRLSALYGTAFGAHTLAITPDRARDASMAVVGTIAIQWIAQMNADGTGYLAQRTMACRSDRDARQAAVVFVLAQVLMRSLLWIPIALGLLVLFPVDSAVVGTASVAAREETFVTGIATLLPSGVRGLMMIGMLAALASTLDTHLNWGASYWTNDLYRRLYCQALRGREPGARELVWVARISSLLVLVLSIGVLTHLRSIQAAWQATLLLGAGMGLPLVLRWVWWRMHAAAELAAIAVSTALAPWLLSLPAGEGGRLLIMASASTVTCIAAVLFGPSAPGAQVLTFYRRVHPPGFWAPVAARCGDEASAPAARLRLGLFETTCAAFAVFCALVGLSTWLFHSPPPLWFPWRRAWIGLCSAGAAFGWTALWLPSRHRKHAGSTRSSTRPTP